VVGASCAWAYSADTQQPSRHFIISLFLLKIFVIACISPVGRRPNLPGRERRSRPSLPGAGLLTRRADDLAPILRNRFT
jgi:hypothetical protein